MDDKKLSDNEAGDRIHAAEEILGDEPGETEWGDAALMAARKALMLIRLALIKAGVKSGD